MLNNSTHKSLFLHFSCRSAVLGLINYVNLRRKWFIAILFSHLVRIRNVNWMPRNGKQIKENKVEVHSRRAPFITSVDWPAGVGMFVVMSFATAFIGSSTIMLKKCIGRSQLFVLSYSWSTGRNCAKVIAGTKWQRRSDIKKVTHECDCESDCSLWLIVNWIVVILSLTRLEEFELKTISVLQNRFPDPNTWQMRFAACVSVPRRLLSDSLIRFFTMLCRCPTKVSFFRERCSKISRTRRKDFAIIL